MLVSCKTITPGAHTAPPRGGLCVAVAVEGTCWAQQELTKRRRDAAVRELACLLVQSLIKRAWLQRQRDKLWKCVDDADARADLPVLVETNKDDRSTTGQIDVIFFVGTYFVSTAIRLS